MKKIVCLILILLSLLALVSCGSKESGSVTTDGVMVQVEYDPVLCTRIFVDRDTRVCYLYRCTSSGYLCVAVMVNADGTPKLWDGKLE